MTYRELLEYCKLNPGCLGQKEQKEADRIIIKYRLLSQKTEKK